MKLLKHESVFHLKILVRERKNLPKNGVRSSFVGKNVFVLSLPSPSLTLQMKVAQMRLKGSKFGVNMNAWR